MITVILGLSTRYADQAHISVTTALAPIRLTYISHLQTGSTKRSNGKHYFQSLLAQPYPASLRYYLFQELFLEKYYNYQKFLYILYLQMYHYISKMSIKQPLANSIEFYGGNIKPIFYTFNRRVSEINKKKSIFSPVILCQTEDCHEF